MRKSIRIRASKKKLVTLSMIILLPITTYALSMSDCKIGSKVYIDKVIDIEAVIVDKDHTDDTVKVRLNSGKIKWVKISDLMSPIGKKVEDKIEKEIGKAIFKWMFSKEEKEEK